MKRLLLIAVFCGLSTTAVLAQDSLYNVATESYTRADYRVAYENFKKAGLLYQLKNQFAAYSQCSLYMALCLNRLGMTNESLELANNTKDYLLKILPTNNYLLAENYRIIGESTLQLGKNEEALSALQKTESLYPDSAAVEKSACFSSLGITYWNNGNQSLAKKYHNEALRIRKEVFGPASLPVADSYNNLGLLFLEDNGLEAGIYLNRALKIYSNFFGEVHPKVAQTLINLAQSKGTIGLYSEAFEILEKVQNIWNEVYPDLHPAKAFTINTTGQLHYKKSAYDQAIILHEEALTYYLRLYGPRHPEVANTHFLIGRSYQQLGDFKLASENFQKALYSNLQSGDYTNIYDLPPADNYFNGDFQLTYLLAKAKALEAQYFEKSLKPKDLKGAIYAYQKADTLVDELRKIRFDETDKIRLSETSRLIYANGIRLASVLKNQPFIGNRYDQLLFNFFERSKSSALLQAVQDTRAKEFAGIPLEIIATEDSLLTEISYIKQRLASGSEDEILHKKLFQYEKSYNDLVEKLENDFPRYFELKYKTISTTLEEYQKGLNADEEGWFYFLTEDILYTLLVSPRRVDLIEKDIDFNLQRMISGMRNALRFRLPAVQDTLSSQLYEKIIPPSLRAGRVTIFMDGELSTLPLEVLRNPTNQKYLIEEVEISYDFSASLAAGKNRPRKTKKSALLFAPVNFEGHEVSLAPLPGSESEVGQIKYQLLSKGYNVQTYRGREASEERLDSANQVQFLHFATHGYVDSDRPELSKIYLSPVGQKDGILFSGEIYNLNLNADLVVLSACETGLGKIAKGEGVIGLSRALTYAGAQHQIVSFWKVSDTATAILMDNFYSSQKDIESGGNYAEALRSAKIALINSTEYQDPFFWGSFVLIGQ